MQEEIWSVEEEEKAVREWARVTSREAKRYILALGVHDTIKIAQGIRSGELHKSIGYALKKDSGVTIGVSIKFARHGIFVERGVGKNRPKNSTAANKAKKPWLSVTIPARIGILADMVAENTADAAVVALRFQIPGVINMTVAGSKKNG